MAVLPLLLSFTLFIMRSVSRGNGITTAGEMLKVELNGWGSIVGIVSEDDVEGWCSTSPLHDPCLSSEVLSRGFSVVSDGANKYSGNTSLLKGYIPVFSNPFTAVCTVAALEKAALKSFPTWYIVTQLPG
ncbi:hypothetical protein AVEN_38978-1 [Araneus ventricosus]|uniref:RNase H type-1 domain-containing protein n=1 Tax=Araneus ventricosus TaxID=182803 RepID=A0A4Y2KMG5_ARAVE|nr:hypothetical protein AVEN_38978-1 [Araneus ventricosus]